MKTLSLYNNDGTLSTEAQLLLFPKPTHITLGEWIKIQKQFRSKLSEEDAEKFNKERIKAYKQINKEKIKAHHKVYEEANKEKIKLRTKNYEENNKEKLKVKRKAYREANKEKIKTRNQIYRENIKQNLKSQNDVCREDIQQQKSLYPKPRRKANREKARAREKAHRKANKEKIRAKRKAYREANREKVRTKEREYRKSYYQRSNKPQAYSTKYLKERRNKDPFFRLQQSLRTHCCRIVRNLSLGEKPTNTFKWVGCSPEELKAHIESLFQEGMTWDNYGKYGWHVDHIRPVSSFKSEEWKQINHYTNLQPLWAKDNIKKGNKF